eukprot:SAG22_NODE_36_length_27184_cov_65.870076_6_plen_147_part_00
MPSSDWFPDYLGNDNCAGERTPSSGLFNLSPDTPSAGLSAGGKALASGVKMGLGSAWAPVATGGAMSFSATDGGSGKSIATASATPPAAPEVFTLWLIGNQTVGGASVGHASVGGGAFNAQLIYEDDAPKGELCPTGTPPTPPPDH